MVKFIDIPQNCDDWLQLRSGKLTGSGFSKIMANYGKSFGEPAKKYAVDIAIEQITGQFIESTYSNAHMERGHLQEPIARMLYEDEYFCDVANGGFFDAGFVGVSPDGIPSEDGLIEIKSVIPSVHYANIKRQSVDPAYKWQIIGNMKFSEKDWIDFVSYCADFPVDKQLYIYRLHAKNCADEYGMMDERITLFKQLVEESKNLILTSEYSIY